MQTEHPGGKKQYLIHCLYVIKVSQKRCEGNVSLCCLQGKISKCLT